MFALGIHGSPRSKSNTEELLKVVLSRLNELGCKTEMLRLRELKIFPCTSCRRCIQTGECCIRDDFSRVIVPKLLACNILIIATPVCFDNVSSLTKIFMDRTWCLRGKLKNKILGCIVVGRGYGLDSALVAIHNWGLKHKMILGDRGVIGRAFEYCEILQDKRAINDARMHAERLFELASLLHGNYSK